MKILFSLTYYTPYSSGLTLYVKRLGEALVKKGHEVTVLTMDFDKKQPVEQVINGVEVVRADYFFKISKGFVSFDWLIKSCQEVQKADAIFINLPQFEGIIPALCGKILGKKVISIYHCEVDLPDGLSNKFVELGLNLANWVTLTLSDKIITYTKDFADNSKLLPRFRSKLSFVYPPIIPPKVDKSIQKILIEKIGRKSEFTIGVAARLAAEKGMEYLLEALPQIISNIKYQIPARNASHIEAGGSNKQIPIKIVIAGSMAPVGEEDYKKKILNLVGKYKEYVVFLGELKEEEMGSFYSLCDVLVLPSVNSTEGFGMVQVEAMMMGVPVVVTDLPGVRIPIRETGMGLIVPIKNSQKLAEEIVEVLLNRNRYIKDTSLIKKEFSFEKTINFYQDLMDKI